MVKFVKSNLAEVLVIAIIIFILCIVVAPILFIWALNTLFNLGIGYTFWTWLAVLILFMSFNATTNITVGKTKA